MRQNSSELVRRAEAGERLTVTVAGRPAAVLGPVAPRRWRQWDEISDLFRTPSMPSWQRTWSGSTRNPKIRGHGGESGDPGYERAHCRRCGATSGRVGDQCGELGRAAFWCAARAGRRCPRPPVESAERDAAAVRPFTGGRAVAESYGLLASHVAKAGRQRRARVMDLLIAATARAHDAALFTRNSLDLHGLEGLVEIVIV
jgi:prevent-host-death family protein